MYILWEKCLGKPCFIMESSVTMRKTKSGAAIEFFEKRSPKEASKRLTAWTITEGLEKYAMTDERPALRARVAKLEAALQQSVELQSHYAELLNMHDGGHRLTFANAGGVAGSVIRPQGHTPMKRTWANCSGLGQALILPVPA